jgi:hypothetical protein
MIDSGADPVDIGKVLLRKEPGETQPFNWKEQERLRTDFTKEPAMPVVVEADSVDRPSSQRIYGNPTYDQNGDLRCRCCGGVMGRNAIGTGEGIAVCTDIGCRANGFAYAEGSVTRNPHRGLGR